MSDQHEPDTGAAMEAVTEIRPKTITVEQAATELGIGRNLAYQLARSGELPGVLRLGHRLVVVRERFDAMLAGEDNAA